MPDEIAELIRGDKEIEKFPVDEFFDRVTEREGGRARKPDAVFHARAVTDVLQDAVSKREVEELKHQLPDEFQAIFESGSEGQLEFDQPWRYHCH